MNSHIVESGTDFGTVFKGERVLVKVLGSDEYQLTCDHCEAVEIMNGEELLFWEELFPSGCSCPDKVIERFKS